MYYNKIFVHASRSYQALGPRTLSKHFYANTLSNHFVQALYPSIWSKHFIQGFYPSSPPKHFTQALDPGSLSNRFIQVLNQHTLSNHSIQKLYQGITIRSLYMHQGITKHCMRALYPNTYTSSKHFAQALYPSTLSKYFIHAFFQALDPSTLSKHFIQSLCPSTVSKNLLQALCSSSWPKCLISLWVFLFAYLPGYLLHTYLCLWGSFYLSRALFCAQRFLRGIRSF